MFVGGGVGATAWRLCLGYGLIDFVWLSDCLALLCKGKSAVPLAGLSGAMPG